MPCGEVQVVFLKGLLEESLEALQQQGDKHLAAHQYKEAVASYDKALLALQQQQHQQQQQQQQQQQPSGSAQAELCQMLLSVLLNLSAAHLQLRQPPALLYATAAAALSSHKSSKAYYRAAVALDQLVGGLTSAMSADSNCGVAASIDPAAASRLAAAATAMMEGSVSLTGNTTPAAKAQMMAALTNVAANRGAGGKVGSSKRWVAENGEWQLVCDLLSVGADDSTKLDSALAGCFSSSSSSSSGGGCADAASAVSAAGKEKELGNTAFKKGDFATALKHYQAALASLQSSLGPIPTLLSSRAKAWLQQPSKHSQQHAFTDGLTAALLDPKGCAEGFQTAALALLQLDETAGAQAWCQLGLQLLPNSSELQGLLQRIRTATTAAAAAEAAAQSQKPQPAAGSSSGSGSSAGSSNSSGKSGKGKQGKKKTNTTSSSSSSKGGHPPAESMTERQMKEFMQEGALGVEQLSMMNQIAELALSMAGRGGRAGGRGGRAGGRGRGGAMDDSLLEMLRPDGRVPDLREEFAKAGR